MSLAVIGCGDKAPSAASTDCETDAVKTDLLADFAVKLREEGLKGHTAASIKELLSIKEVALIEKSTEGYSRCSAKVVLRYPVGLTENIARAFSSAKSYEAFKDQLEQRYGVVDGAGLHAQLMDAIAEGPFGSVPTTPDPATVATYQKTVQKNLDALMAEKLDIAMSYELRTGTDPNGKSSQKLKWQIHQRDALDLNVALMSIGSLY